MSEFTTEQIKDANLHLEAKLLATLTAQLALKGFQVHAVSTGGYFVAKWNLTKFCPAVADLENFAEQVGAA